LILNLGFQADSLSIEMLDVGLMRDESVLELRERFLLVGLHGSVVVSSKATELSGIKAGSPAGRAGRFRLPVPCPTLSFEA
jgi:hypothetical protein